MPTGLVLRSGCWVNRAARVATGRAPLGRVPTNAAGRTERHPACPVGPTRRFWALGCEPPTEEVRFNDDKEVA